MTQELSSSNGTSLGGFPSSRWTWRLLTWVTFALVAWLTLLALLRLQASVLTVLVVLVMTYLLLPVVDAVEGFLRRAQPVRTARLGTWLRAGVVAGVYFFLSLLLVWGGYLLLPVLHDQWLEFQRLWPQYLSQIQQLVHTVLGQSTQWLGLAKSPLWPNAPLRAVPSPATVGHSTGLPILSQGTRSLLHWLPALVSGSFSTLFYLLVGVVLGFYTLLEGPQLPKKAVGTLPVHWQVPVQQHLQTLHRVLQAYIRGQVMLALASGLLMLTLYSVFQVKYALLLSLIFTVAEIVPVVGPWVAFTPGIIVMLFGPNPWVTLYVLSLYAIIKDNWMLPKIVGHAMGMHPVVVILSLLIAAKIAGWVGLIVAVPATSLLGMVFKGLQNDQAPEAREP
jgi:predicted PurR-regulated permease PerM